MKHLKTILLWMVAMVACSGQSPNANVSGSNRPITPFISSSTTISVAGHTAQATNATATVTLAGAGVGLFNVVEGVAWCYSTAPTGGRITVKNAGVAVFSVGITSAGTGFLPVSCKASDNAALTIELAGGGSGVVGDVAACRVHVE